MDPLNLTPAEMQAMQDRKEMFQVSAVYLLGCIIASQGPKHDYESRREQARTAIHYANTLLIEVDAKT